MKHEWKKHEKTIYQQKREPVFLDVPGFNYFLISGEGNPNSPEFGEYITVLYSLSYAARMSYKWDTPPEGYYEYTVYPLEGVWDLTERGRKEYDGELNKDELTFDLMIRQPDFVTAELAAKIIERTKKKKPHPLLDEVRFTSVTDGPSVQILHEGPYDDEPASFRKMEEYCRDEGFKRIEKIHREIYLTDARKTAPEKLKTVLRFKVSETSDQ